MRSNSFIVIVLLIILLISCSSDLGSDSSIVRPEVNNPTNDSSANDSGGINEQQLISYKDLSNYRINLVGAKGLGIQVKAKGFSSSGTTNNDSARDIETTQHYLMMSTTEYNPNTVYQNDESLISVTFTRIVTDDYQTETTGEMDVFANDNGELSFISFNGFVYSIYKEDKCLISRITDNDESDKNDTQGLIVVEGFDPAEQYIVNYWGIGEERVVTQDEIDGEIDKVYILGDYTFLSLVPKGTSSRPIDSQLVFESDGISSYDKSDYYSDNRRQSYVISNNTGYIYKIEGININRIQGGCLISTDGYTIYDFMINDNSELEIYPILANPAVHFYQIFKDKYGHIFIDNDKINSGDSSKGVTYYVLNGGQQSSRFLFQKTTDGTAIKLELCSYDGTGIPDSHYFAHIVNAWIVLEDGSLREINESDSFSVISANNLGLSFIVDKGIIKTFGDYNSTSFVNMVSLGLFNSNTKKWKQGYLDWTDNHYYLSTNIREHDVLMIYYDSKLYSVKDVFSLVDEYFSENTISGYFDVLNHQDYEGLSLVASETFTFDNGSFISYTPFGNIYYDVVIEEENGEPAVYFYESGTYESEKIIYYLQPLNV